MNLFLEAQELELLETRKIIEYSIEEFKK